jgi:hypothetical protein
LGSVGPRAEIVQRSCAYDYAKMTMAPATRGHLKIPRCKRSVQFQYLVRQASLSSYSRRLSLHSLLNEFLHHNGENGPGGIRTRICDLDRELCYRCTTGPERILRGSARNRKVVGHGVLEHVPNRDKRWRRRSKGPSCRTERDKGGHPPRAPVSNYLKRLFVRISAILPISGSAVPVGYGQDLNR